MDKTPIRITQITDCHLGESEGDELLSMNPDDSLHDVLALMNHQRPNNDLLLLTGDLANHPCPSVYQRLHSIIKHNVNYPFAWLAGNHDDPKMMAALGDSVNMALHVLGNWVVVLLNSRVAGATHGELSQQQLDFVQASLAKHRDKHVMVTLHHQPVPIGSAWMDRYIVSNAADFWRVIDAHHHVKIVLWGHVHQAFSAQRQQVALFATPSSCIQFTPNQDEFGVEDSMPGYRWFELNDDGTFTTAVERVATKDYGTNYQSAGY